ncbi:GNAT family N-acetyltransferase [Kutzneria kofuensis]|uniref:Putative acetyltransferase n=1 Tax=Kutzneria kofuensis TaxID=103725 RepID=A0A7W9KSN1_9PSEU|nr:GNAT family N-acetyltransferase [Kutzneria kofuensis]MBB5898020.1 putative acetyltransferase [Kutzneria kofuensis]
MQNGNDQTQPGRVTLRLADTTSRPVVERLGQLERHDLSPWTGDLPGYAGLFDYPRLSRFFTDADHDAYLIYSDGQLAGFSLVRPFDGGATFIHAFFVVRALRRQGVGLAAATDLLRSRRGRWAIAFLEQNAPAARFWKQVAAEVVGENWTEKRRHRPDGATFTFIHLDVDQDERIHR